MNASYIKFQKSNCALYGRHPLYSVMNILKTNKRRRTQEEYKNKFIYILYGMDNAMKMIHVHHTIHQLHAN